MAIAARSVSLSLGRASHVHREAAGAASERAENLRCAAISRQRNRHPHQRGEAAAPPPPQPRCYSLARSLARAVVGWVTASQRS